MWSHHMLLIEKLHARMIVEHVRVHGRRHWAALIVRMRRLVRMRWLIVGRAAHVLLLRRLLLWLVTMDHIRMGRMEGRRMPMCEVRMLVRALVWVR